jgi:hypothetical protein
MRNVEGYFEKIRSVYNRDFPVQPAHVSIYVQGEGAVSIDSIEEMESFKQIKLPGIQEILNAIDF